MTDNEKIVEYEVKHNGIATLTLSRPYAMNALNEELVNQLENNFLKADTDEHVKAIVIKGAGKQFVAGADVRFFIDKIQTHKINEILSFTSQTSQLFLAIENSKKLTIAVLDGLSLGGGSELALACQAIIATDSGSLGFPETAIGIYPGLGGMPRLARKIGPFLTKYYVFTGTKMSAQEAFDLGLVKAIVSPGEIEQTIDKLIASRIDPTKKRMDRSDYLKKMEALFSSDYLIDQIERNSYDIISGKLSVKNSETQKILHSLKQKAPLALKTANTIIDMQIGKNMEEAVKIELAQLREIFSTDDALEGLSSVGSRQPNFKGV